MIRKKINLLQNITEKPNNETVNDLMKITVLNVGNNPKVVSCQVYFPHKSQLVEFDARNDIESYADDIEHETLLEPATLTSLFVKISR